MDQEKLNDMYDTLLQSPEEELYQIEADFYLEFYYADQEIWPDFITAFMVLTNWQDSSLRSGVWTYYEIADAEELQRSLEYLKMHAPAELAEQFKAGIHDYAGNQDHYPEQWMEESDAIDQWIFKNGRVIEEWLKHCLIDNREEIVSLLSEE